MNSCSDGGVDEKAAILGEGESDPQNGPKKNRQSTSIIYEAGLSTGEERLQVLENLAPEVGLEPTTLRLTAECSAIELLRSVGKHVRKRAALIYL
jgi:hypothetical protein